MVRVINIYKLVTLSKAAPLARFIELLFAQKAQEMRMPHYWGSFIRIFVLKVEIILFVDQKIYPYVPFNNLVYLPKNLNGKVVFELEIGPRGGILICGIFWGQKIPHVVWDFCEKLTICGIKIPHITTQNVVFLWKILISWYLSKSNFDPYVIRVFYTRDPLFYCNF